MKSKYIENPCRYSAIPLYKLDKIQDYNIVVLHDQDITNYDFENYSTHQRFFRLIHRFKNIQTNDIEGYHIRTFNLDKDITLAVKLINNSYQDIHISELQIRAMLNSKYYYKDLWVFIVDDRTNKEVALGICQFDDNIKEIDFDWIQVLPKYRGKGLGSMLVSNLLLKSSIYGDFATVSGDLDNRFSPENLYRRCGFYGEDIWHVLQKQK